MMKADEKIKGMLKPQRLAGSRLDGYTAKELAGQLGLNVSTVRNHLNALKERGQAAVFQPPASGEGLENFWFSELWRAPAVVAEPVTLPPPSFDTPAKEPQAEPQPASKAPTAWVRCFVPKSHHRHLRSPHSSFSTRCGIRITGNWAVCSPQDIKDTLACAGCQRAAQTQKLHQHQWLPSGPYAEYCTVKGCKAMRRKGGD